MENVQIYTEISAREIKRLKKIFETFFYHVKTNEESLIQFGKDGLTFFLKSGKYVYTFRSATTIKEDARSFIFQIAEKLGFADAIKESLQNGKLTEVSA